MLPSPDTPLPGSTGSSAALAGPGGRRAFAWANWRTTWWAATALLILRIIYLIWLNPYQLAADEAHYWEWSRRPALSYYSKGPGVAWAIGLSTSVFGDSEWAIRLPAAVSWWAAMLLLACLATLAGGGDQRIGFFAALFFALTPAFTALGQFMTIDAPLIACWAGALYAGWIAVDGAQNGRVRYGAWLGLGLALGIGFLFKYTILLLLPGLAGYGMIAWRRQRPPVRTAAAIALCLGFFLIAISPVIIWNARHDWSTVRHLLGHLHAPGGDIAPRKAWQYNPMWTVEMVIGQLGIVGPPLVALIIIALIRMRRRGVAFWSDYIRFAFWTAVPTLAFYLLVSLATDVEVNWPLGAWVSLVIIPAGVAVVELGRYQQLVGQWRSTSPADRPRAGYLRRKPETPFQIAFHWSIGWGVVAALGIAGAPLLQHIPAFSDWTAWDRINGHRRRATEVHEALVGVSGKTDRPPMIIVDHYGHASLLAFYLPGRPRVFSAASFMGGRQSQYDQFKDTDLANPRLRGRPAVLVGGEQRKWTDALRFEQVKPIDADRELYVGLGYQGPMMNESSSPEVGH